MGLLAGGCLGETGKDLGTGDSSPYRFLHHPNPLLQRTSHSAVTYTSLACGTHLSPSCPCKGHFVPYRAIFNWDPKAQHRTIIYFVQTANKVYPEGPTSSGGEEHQ